MQEGLFFACRYALKSAARGFSRRHGERNGLIAAAALLGRAAVMRTQMGKTRASLAPVGMNRDIQRVLTLESGEVMLVLRRENMMLLACTGDPEKLLGVSYTALRDNIANLNAAFSDKSRCYAVWKKYMAWDGREMFDEAVQSGDGRWMRFIVRRTPDGEYDLLCFRDITALHDRIEECEKRLAGAEEESRAKTTFLSRMSHEIRTPMNGIIGMISLAKSRLRPGDEAMQYLNKADEVSGHLLALINDILDLSKIEAGTLEYVYANVDINKMVSEIEQATSIRLTNKDVRLVTVTPLPGLLLYTDQRRITQVFNNFISNALKFTAAGSITIGYGMPENSYIRFYVTDTGTGISSENAQGIFNRFVKLDSFKQGTGLGLAISQNIVKELKGEIGVESQLSKGSTFWFTLPFYKMDAHRSIFP